MAPKKSRTSAPKHSISEYPTVWSKWEWIAKEQHWARYRKFGPGDGDYEYEYDRPSVETSSPAPIPTQNIGGASSSGQEVALSWNTEPNQEISRSRSTAEENQEDRNVTSLAGQFSGTHLGSNDPAGSQGRGEVQSYTRGPAAPTVTFASGDQKVPPTVEPARWVRPQDRNTKVDALDKNFKVHKSREFEFGRVFKVLWAEPSGLGARGTEITVKQGKYGEPPFQKIRRFLIVRNNKGHCTCLSILTYGGQGTLKPGIHSDDHAAIYSSNNENPYILPGEKLSKRPIKMIPEPAYETLDPMSRINYAKVYTVEHNVKVVFIGHITGRHLDRVVSDYNSTHQPLPNVPPAIASRDDELRGTEGQEPAYVATTSSRLEQANISWATPTGYSPQLPRQGSRGSFSYPLDTSSGSGESYPSHFAPLSRERDQHSSYQDSQEEVPYAPTVFPSNVATTAISLPVISSTYNNFPPNTQQASHDSQEPTQGHSQQQYDRSLYDED